MGRLRESGRRGERVRGSVIRWDYDPLPRQRDFHRCGKRYKLYGGAMGGGKSYALCAEIIKQGIRWPGNRIYLCRDQIVDLIRTTLVTFDSVVPAGLIKQHYRQDRVIKLINGSEILYGGLGGEEDIERIKSAEFGCFAIDEATETIKEMFLLLTTRLRWKLRDGSRPAYHGLLASNPEPGWVKELFVDHPKEQYAFIQALPKDNFHLPTDYYQTLSDDLPEEWKKRYLEGSWDTFEGQVYTEFSRNRHVYSGLEVSPHWEKFRVIDHGYKNPTCVLFCYVDHDGRIWVDDEHYRAGWLVEEHAAHVRRQHPEFWESTTLCDPSMEFSTMQKYGRPWSWVDEYREYGISCVSPYQEEGHVQEGVGINLVKQRFKHGSLMINARCTNTIREILGLKWATLKATRRGVAQEKEVAVDADNHATDCLRYACVWRPMPSVLDRERQENEARVARIRAMLGQVPNEFIGWKKGALL